MIPALSPNGLAGIVPGIGLKHKDFNCCLSIHQVISPIVYFCLKNEGLFPLEKRSSNASRLNRDFKKLSQLLNCSSHRISSHRDNILKK